MKKCSNILEDGPLVSVVLCTYNDERFIAKAMQSVLKQTYTNFEFIIWNDGSSDRTEDIIKSFNDARIRYFYHENTGVGKAAQLACEHVKGKYIARIDGDDVCMPERVQKEVEFLERHPDYVVVSSSVYYIDEEDNVLGRSFPATSNTILQRMLEHDDPIVHPASMFRTDAFLKCGGYVGLRQSLDHVLFGRLRKHGKIKNLPTPLLLYRLRSKSLSHHIEGSAYDFIMHTYRNKIISDEVVNERDVEIYNQIFKESRTLKRTKEKAVLYKKTTDERFFEFIRKFIGHNNAEVFVFILKNLYCRIKYRA